MLKNKVFLILVMIILSAAACQSAPAELPEVTFVGTEYAYEGPQEIAGGWTQVTFDNQGDLPHELMLIRLLDGRTLDDIPSILESEGTPPDWIEMVGSASAAGGESASFISNLPAGSYAMMSFGSQEEGPPDVMQGMLAALTVTEPENEVPDNLLPEADASISLVDYQFVIEGLQAGEQTIRVSNDGSELHEAIIFRLQDGKTIDDMMAFMEAGGDGAPPMENAGSVFLSPGNVTYTTMDLEAGNYVFLCFIPSEKNEMQPHFMLGMMSEVSVQ